MLPLVALAVTLSAASQPQLVGPSQRPGLLKSQALRGGGTLKPMRIVAKTVDGVLNFDPLLIFDRGDGNLLWRAVATIVYSAIATCVQGTAFAFCFLIVPMFWLLPFTLTMSMYVPVAMTESSGTRLVSPLVLLKRCRKLAAGQKRKIFWAQVYGHFAAWCVASLVLIPLSIAFDMFKHAAHISQLPSSVYVIPGLYAWLATIYVDFLIYDELASHAPEQTESMA